MCYIWAAVILRVIVMTMRELASLRFKSPWQGAEKLITNGSTEVASRTCCKSKDVSPRGVGMLSGHLHW